MADFATQRSFMVSGQIIPNNITDQRIINALANIPRELFVPEPSQKLAYIDAVVPMQQDRFLLPPMVLAQLIQALELDLGDKVLDIGCASGYSTALLSHLANTVVGLESNQILANHAGELLEQLEAGNSIIVNDDLINGAPQHAPFDAILLQGAVEFVPPELFAQLADPGKLVTVVQYCEAVGHAVLFTKVQKIISQHALFDACLPVLKGFRLSGDFNF